LARLASSFACISAQLGGARTVDGLACWLLTGTLSTGIPASREAPRATLPGDFVRVDFFFSTVGFALAADADDDDTVRPGDLERAVDRLVSESFSVNASSRRTPPVFDLAPRSAGAADTRMLLCGHAGGRERGELCQRWRSRVYHGKVKHVSLQYWGARVLVYDDVWCGV
jgi:hypothetical protein